MMKVGITGGTGFVGSALIDRLSRSSGNQLRCIARDVSAAKSRNLSEQVEWVPGDLSADGWQSEFVSGCDAIVHSGLWRSSESFRADEDDLVNYLRINFLGTIKLIEAAVAAGVKRFVFLSTCAVHERILDDRPLDEAHPLWAANHYGAHKAAIEKFVHSYGFGSGFEICALRPTGIYGIAHPVPRSKWYSLIEAVAAGGDITVSGGGKEVHVSDVAAAIELLLTTDEVITGQAYACYDQYISRHTVATLAKEMLQSDCRIVGDAPTPKHQIVTEKIRGLGMTFGGRPLLEQTVAEMARHISDSPT